MIWAAERPAMYQEFGEPAGDTGGSNLICGFFLRAAHDCELIAFRVLQHLPAAAVRRSVRAPVDSRGAP